MQPNNKYIESKNGFTVPEFYFENLISRIMANATIELENEVRDNKFTVPNNYFKTLNKQIVSKTTQKPTLAKKYHLRWWVSAAAAVLVFTLFFMYKQPSNISQTSFKLNTLSEDEIINHLTKTGYSIDLLCEAGWCNEIKNKQNSKLENYIIEHIDETLLMEEL